MGNKQTSCCSKENITKEHEEKFGPDRDFFNKQDNNPDIEQLESFQFSYENIIKYLTTSFENKYLNQSHVSEKLNVFDLEREEIDNAEKLNKKGSLFLINKDLGDFKIKKYILKVLKFSYDEVTVTEEDIKKKSPLQYFENKNILKELRITRNHQNRFLIKSNGFFIDNHNYKIYLVYDYYEYSLEKFINDRSLDFVNKIRIMKTLIELVKTLHTSGLISLDLSISSLRFTLKKFHLKLVSYGNSFDMKSVYDIDRNTILDRTKGNIHHPPEIILHQINKINWQCDIWSFGVIISMIFSNQIHHMSHDKLSQSFKNQKIPEILYQNVENIFIKSMIVGILRIDSLERPNVFEIIDVYNKLVKELKLSDEYLIQYTQEEVLNFTRIFHKSTHLLLNDEINLIREDERFDNSNLEFNQKKNVDIS